MGDLWAVRNEWKVWRGGRMERWVWKLKEKGLLVGRGLEAGCVKALSGVPGYDMFSGQIRYVF